MLKLLSIVVYFLRELIFDSKDEYDFKSSKFNARKFSVLVVMVSLIFLMAFFFARTWSLAKANIKLKQQISEQCGKNTPLASSDSENKGHNHAKNQRKSSSDSR